ncbi:MAG: hypothetical protein Q4G52_06085 [Clostridia bacterium]|nr:hypothetical protein [Clostridia bacterium]
MKKGFLMLACLCLLVVSCTGMAETADLSGTGTAYAFQNAVTRVEIATDADGVVTDMTLDQALPPFSWARVAVTEEELENPPEGVLVGGISLTSATRAVMAFSEYICIDGRIFQGTLRAEDDPWLQYNTEQTVKYASVDGEIEDLMDWIVASEENMIAYYEDCVARNMYICLEDGSPNPRATGSEYLVKAGLEHAGEPSLLKSTTDLSFEETWFNWDANLEAVYDSIIGTKMVSEVSDLELQKGEDGKSYWTTLDAVSGATLSTYPLLYETAKNAYNSIMESK